MKKKSRNFYTKQNIFESRLASILLTSTKEVYDLFSIRIKTIIRINNLADEPNKIYKKLENLGLEMEKIPWTKYAYVVHNKDKSDLGETKEYEKGLFYIQSSSSMIPSIVLDPKEKEKILDMCAAPGSKTSHMASLMNNKGEITAVDVDFDRIQRLKEIQKQFHVNNIKLRKKDVNEIVPQHTDYFDKILLDAPCSGEGLIYLKGRNPLRNWSIKKINYISTQQKRLISSAFKMLKPGGILVYSTCTLEPEENEAVVTHLLNSNERAKCLKIKLREKESFKNYKRYTTSGITKWSGNTYHPETEKSLRIIPSELTQAFYVAKLTKMKI